MAGFGDTLRGDGLARTQRALARLEADPQRLHRARVRFDDSPTLYKSDRSGTTTRSPSPIPPSEQRRQERRIQLGREREASEPHKQFSAQVEEERRRIWNAHPRTSWMTLKPGNTFSEEASENVKKSWVEQGIWNNKWNQFALGRWKHEEPLQLESESETDSEAEPSPPIFSFFLKESQLKPRRPKSEEEKQRITERRVIREREREASRPYHQFVYQISKERKRIQGDSANEEGTGLGNADINTRAYEAVKDTWTKRGIWNEKWGILPGMSWKHEEPLEDDETAGCPAPQRSPVENGSYEGEQGHTRPLFTPGETPPGRIFRASCPVESDRRQASGVMNQSEQGPSADVTAGLENSNTVRSPLAPNSPRPRTGKRDLRPMTGEAARLSRRKLSSKEGQPHPVPNTPLSPIHPSKVSKGALMKKPRRQRLLRVSEIISAGLPSSSEGCAEPLPPPEAPRRSNRIQTGPGVAKDPTRAVSTGPSKRLSKPERNVTTRSSAKPQGISKNQHVKSTRGTRKE